MLAWSLLDLPQIGRMAPQGESSHLQVKNADPNRALTASQALQIAKEYIMERVGLDGFF